MSIRKLILIIDSSPRLQPVKLEQTGPFSYFGYYLIQLQKFFISFVSDGFSCMQKLILSFIPVIIAIGIALVGSQLSHAQQTSTPVNFTKIFSESKDFKRCIEGITGLPPGENCYSIVDVLYEDGSTVALKSGYIDTIWKGVAEVKKYGYKIDAITSYPISDYGSNRQTVNILVVMSK